MNGSAVRMRLAFAAKAFIVVALVASAAVLVRLSLLHRHAAPRHAVDLSRWAVLDRPRWSTLTDVVAVRDASGLASTRLPLYDRHAADDVRRALEAAPGVRRVARLKRLPPDRIQAVLELRVPAVAVRLDDGRYVEVDAEGVVLGVPGDDRPVRDGLALRVVSGAADFVPRPGKMVRADVAEGVALCLRLDAHRDGRGRTVLRTFDEVDVANLRGRLDPRRSEILLRAAPPTSGGPPRTGCVVEWGRVEGAIGEPPFADKADRLLEATRHFVDFDGVARVRVAFAELSVLPVDGPEGQWLPALAEQLRTR